jgi:hypothetical protein
MTKMGGAVASSIFLASILSFTVPAASAQSDPTYFSSGGVKALYYKPDNNPRPRIGFLIVHRTGNYLTHIGCTELSKRGYGVFCMNTRYENNETLVDWDRIALDVKVGVEYLRKQPGMEKVILFGHSGGGPTTSFYQAVAEKGIAFCKDPKKIVPCNDDLANLPVADGIVFADAHLGVPAILLRSLNGSVIDETPKKFNPLLDPYSTANGYNPNGSSNYSADFRARYFAAQSARMNALIDSAQRRTQEIKAGNGPYPDNDILVIPHGGNPGSGPGGASLLSILDVNTSLRRTNAPQKLLKNDASISRQIVASVGSADPKTLNTTMAFDSGTKLLTLRSFLSTQAVRSTNALNGIDHCSTNNSTVCAVKSISVPTLIMGMGGHYFIRDSEEEFEASAAADKDLVYIEGATHGFTPCANCMNINGAADYSNSVKNLFDYVHNWTSDRYGRSRGAGDDHRAKSGGAARLPF